MSAQTELVETNKVLRNLGATLDNIQIPQMYGTWRTGDMTELVILRSRTICTWIYGRDISYFLIYVNTISAYFTISVLNFFNLQQAVSPYVT